jgi:hypothetical protein
MCLGMPERTASHLPRAPEPQFAAGMSSDATRLRRNFHHVGKERDGGARMASNSVLHSMPMPQIADPFAIGDILADATS